MYLKLLDETEKANFSKIAQIAVHTNKKFHEVKGLILQEYYHETGLKLVETAMPSDSELEEILGTFKTRIARRIVYFEMFGLFNVDAEYSNEEKAFMEKFKKVMELTDEECKSLCDLALEMVATYMKGVRLLNA